MTLRVIAAYRPCKPSSAGPTTAYSQQLRYFDATKVDRCPRTAILEDLGEQLQTWRQQGDQIVLLMDVNEEVSSRQWKRWLQQHGLRDVIHDSHKGTLPPTYHRGSKAIDGIFVSHTIQAVQCGYMPFGQFPSDHRALWVDLHFQNVFGYKMPPIEGVTARRVNSDDPRSRKKFN